MRNTPLLAPAMPDTPAHLSWWRIAATVLFVAFALFVSTVQLSGDDFWLQAKIGELIVRDGAIPQTLLFPFTEIASDRFNAHEWLASIAFHALLVELGEDGMPFFIGFLGLVLASLMARLAYVRSAGSYPLALFGGCVTLVAENYRHVLRPELPTLILMALLWNLLEAFSKRPRGLHYPAAAGIMVLWANMHGSFILGPIMVGMYLADITLDTLRCAGLTAWRPGPKVWSHAALLCISAAACLINPFGWELIAFVFSFSVHSDASVYLTEWLPTFDPRIYGVRGLWVALAVWLAMTALLAAHHRRVRAVEWLFYAAFTFLAYRAIRFPVYLGMVFAYIASGLLPRDSLTRWGEVRRLQMLCAAMALALPLIAAFGNASESRPYTLGDRTKFTRPMVRALGHPALQGNVLNSMEFGAELIYRSYPRLRPAIDCRFDSYGTDYNLYIGALFRDDALLSEFVARYDVRYLLMNVRQFEAFQTQGAWQQRRWRVYEADHRAVLLQRSDVHQGTPLP